MDYKSCLEDLTRELLRLQKSKDGLQDQRAQLARAEKEVDTQIDAIAQAVSAFRRVVPDEKPNPSVLNILLSVGQIIIDAGLTARILGILHLNAPCQMSALDIRRELEGSGFYLGDYSNALSTIYTTLRRLVNTKQITEVVTAEGRRFQGKAAVQSPASTNKAPVMKGGRRRLLRAAPSGEKTVALETARMLRTK
jgi:hypothetical protein